MQEAASEDIWAVCALVKLIAALKICAGAYGSSATFMLHFRELSNFQ